MVSINFGPKCLKLSRTFNKKQRAKSTKISIKNKEKKISTKIQQKTKRKKLSTKSEKRRAFYSALADIFMNWLIDEIQKKTLRSSFKTLAFHYLKQKSSRKHFLFMWLPIDSKFA